MKNFYQTVTLSLSPRSYDEWVEYEGEDLDEAIKKRDIENRNNCDPKFYTEVRKYKGETLDEALFSSSYDIILEKGGE